LKCITITSILIEKLYSVENLSKFISSEINYIRTSAIHAVTYISSITCDNFERVVILVEVYSI